MADSIPGLEEIPRRSFSEIRGSEANPRKIPQAAIDSVANSLQRFGWQQPIVVDKGGEIIVGHTRMLAALSLGEEAGPIVVAANLTPEEVTAYRIADNRSGEYSGWDYRSLAEQLGGMDDGLADVLGVSDWAAVMSELDATQVGARELLGVSEETQGRLEGGIEYTVTFDTKEAASAALEKLAEVLSVCDVREKRA